MIYNFYVERDSILHTLDPRVKLIGSASIIVLLLLFNSPVVLIPFFFLIMLFVYILGKITFYEQYRVLKPLFPILVITIVVWAFVYDPWYKGTLIGVAYGLRLLTFGLIAFSLLMTTTQRELILGFIKLKMPYEYGLTMTIALRYIPTLYMLALNIMDAQKARGWEMEKGNILVRIRKMSAVLIPLLIASIKTAHELSIALESRAFGARKDRTFLYTIEMKRRDYVALLLTGIILIIALYVRYSLGFGHIKLY
ncbi:energy-coupling factor transporter transmembrane component T family protein [Thermococcus sp.]